MILWRLRHGCLALVVLCSACSSMDDSIQLANVSGKHDWFEYAYSSSAATLEELDDGATRAKPLKLQ